MLVIQKFYRFASQHKIMKTQATSGLSVIRLRLLILRTHKFAAQPFACGWNHSWIRHIIAIG